MGKIVFIKQEVIAYRSRKSMEKMPFKKNHFSKTSGNLGFWPTLNEGLDPKGQLAFNVTRRAM